jgi:DNA-binding MarR family transcriptional regulator
LDTRTLDFDPIQEARRQWVDHGWEAAADGMTAVTSLMRAHQLVLARVDTVLRPFELTFARYELLMLLSFSRSGSLPLAKIGARLQVHPTSVTSAVDRLERQRLVKRRPHPTDRRATLAFITRQGRVISAKATQRLNSEVFEGLGIPARSQARLVASIADLRKSAGDFV